MKWQPGQSGNPRGRPPAKWDSLSSTLRKVGDETIGEETQWEKTVRRLFKFAIEGKEADAIRAARIIFDATIKTVEMQVLAERLDALEARDEEKRKSPDST